ncbi:MAG: 3-methyl-2-oxobutanoate hydroxymethyltransferase [gamma proteobacterium symbiont of Bathyaustriella thionipta]|nr:3-methyl-2-oxobutanoate hydroxymethyltransferase [gamma proteobacterium symbiont of Bathyaustriella thionipta]
MQRISISSLMKMKQQAQKIAMLTAYDASFTQAMERAGVEVLLVGDSLGMVVQGHDSTLPVSLDDMIYHCQCVTRASHTAMVIADLPFMTYNSPEQALQSAGRLMKEGGAHLVKLEGGAGQIDNVAALTANGIPVCGHLGLLPQSIHQVGGYKVQGRDTLSAEIIFQDAHKLQEAGIALLILECVPMSLAEKISRQLDIPVIGIGAGAGCDGQVLVSYDLLGLTSGHVPKFVRNFLATSDSIEAAFSAYVAAVKAADFPTIEESFA